MGLTRINYSALNARQKESYNFQKVSAVLADYGFCTIRLSDDWSSADFIAQHIDGSFLKVQLKGRLSFEKKYLRKELWVCFPVDAGWYLYPHDYTLDQIMRQRPRLKDTSSWRLHGSYSFPSLSESLRTMLAPFRIE